MWIIIGALVLVVAAILIARLRRRRKQSTALDPMAAINQWYDGVLDKQTSERAGHADEAQIKRLVEEFDSSYDEGGLAAETLAKIGEPAVPYLMEALKEKVTLQPFAVQHGADIHYIEYLRPRAARGMSGAWMRESRRFALRLIA